MTSLFFENGCLHGLLTPFDRSFQTDVVSNLFLGLPQIKQRATDAWMGIEEGRFSGLAPLFDGGPFDDGSRTTAGGLAYIDERFGQTLPILSATSPDIIPWPHQQLTEHPTPPLGNGGGFNSVGCHGLHFCQTSACWTDMNWFCNSSVPAAPSDSIQHVISLDYLLFRNIHLLIL